MKRSSKVSGSGNKAYAILRVSSVQQESGISQDVQEKVIREYCRGKGLVLEDEWIFRIAESAKRSIDRKKYAGIRDKALAAGVKHQVWYMFDRETRNLTDNEIHEDLARSKQLILHYVTDNKVIDDTSSDSDFFMRDIHAVQNKQFVRNLSTKMKGAQLEKAMRGWYPGPTPPLGYVPQKPRDVHGKDICGQSIIVIDPDTRAVEQVKREFELRSKRLSLRDIRKQIVAEGFVEPRSIPSYSASTLERRLKNRFYIGFLSWVGVEYEGKHETFLDPKIFDAVQQTFDVTKCLRKSEGVFGGGWLKCGQPLCECHIVYDPKNKTLRNGKVVEFRYYHCTNGKGRHQRQTNLAEKEIWAQLEPAVDAISITNSFAEQIADAMNALKAKSRAGVRARMEGYREAMKALEGKEDEAYTDHKGGLLSEQQYHRHLRKIRDDRRQYESLLEKGTVELSDAGFETAKSILELATDAKSLWKERSPLERKMFLEKLLSNPVLDGRTVRYDLKKPLLVLAEMKGNEGWLLKIDEFRTACFGNAA